MNSRAAFGLSILMSALSPVIFAWLYGDFAAGVLAIIATAALARTAAWAILAVWVFNIWGAVDLLFAFYKGARVNLEPGSLGAAFFIPTVVVPPLLVLHGLIFWLLWPQQ